jgi:hypothetical protein
MRECVKILIAERLPSLDACTQIGPSGRHRRANAAFCRIDLVQRQPIEYPGAHSREDSDLRGG